MTLQATDTVLPDPVPTGGRTRRQLSRFAVIGVLSTLVYAAVYAASRGVMSSYWANTFALAVSAIGNTELNRRFTFEVRAADASDRLRHQVRGAVAFLIGLAVTNGLLLILHASAAHPARWLEITVLVGANVTATVLRFVLMRVWVFVPRLASGRAV